ncbi:MAG: ATP synthase F0 subunit C [bacterium]|nr:ATP synthase F0 subunit C [bacterium]
MEGKVLFGIFTMLAASFPLSLAAIGAAIGQGNVIAKGLEGMARNPEASGDIRTNMILGVVLIEALVLYVLLISLLLLFANPVYTRIFG